MLYPLLQVDCTEMCVGSACTQPSYNDKNPSSVCFFNLLICFSLSQIELFVLWCHKIGGPSHDCLIDSSVLAECTGVLPQTRPEWAVVSCFTAGADLDKNDS